MDAIIGLAATFLAVLYTLWPLFKRQSQLELEVADAELLNQRDLALNDIKEVDFDRDLGNLSEEDHQHLREQYKRRAVAILKKLHEQDSQIDEEIERAISAIRRQPARKT